MQDFEGKVAVVTGAASGIGRGLAQRFAEEGMRVVLADVEAGALDAAVAELRDAGHEVRGEQVDVSSQPSVDALAQASFAGLGRGARRLQQRRRRRRQRLGLAASRGRRPDVGPHAR